jgi:hypothetical protein
MLFGDASATWRPVVVAAALSAVGFALTVWIYYPGVMNFDARYILSYVREGHYGDWQSPVMTVLWALVDPLDPGPGSMFLLIASFYWLGFAVLAVTLARQSLWRAVVLVLLALSPPAFVLVGIIWRDVLFAVFWLLAAALTLAVAERDAKVRLPVQVIAIALIALGVLLRPNALLAAPILAGFVLWPMRFFWKRTAIFYLPAAVAGFALVQVVYYAVLDAKREHPLQSIMVFDLGGITHFSKQNQFPGTWTPEQITMLTERCYQPVEWNSYWTFAPCDIVMQRLHAQNIYGTAELVDAWRRAILGHPRAYLQHRFAYMTTFLVDANLTMWTKDLEDSSKAAFADNPRLMAVKAIDDSLAPTPFLRAGSWLVVCAAVVAFGWRRRGTPAGAFAVGACGSAVVYLLTFAAVGVASDFRYAYWAVLAGLAAAVVIWPASWRDRRHSAAVPQPS